MDKFNTLCSLVSQTHLLIEQMDLETLINNQNNQIDNLIKENTNLKEIVDGFNKQVKELNFKYDRDMELLSNELKTKQEELSSLTKVSYIQQINKQLSEKTNYCLILESQIDKLRREQNQPYQPNPVIEKLARKAADVEAELKVQKEESEKAKLNVGKKARKQAPDAVEQVEETSVKEIITADDEENETVQLKKDKKSKKLAEEQVNVIEEIEHGEQKKGKKTKKQLVIDEEPETIVPETPVPETPVIEIEQPKKNKKSKKVVVEQLPDPDTEFNPDNFEDLNGFELLMYKANYYLRDLETSELYDIDTNKPGKIVGLINGKGKVKLH